MPTCDYRTLYDESAGRMGPGYLIRESDHVLLYVDEYIRDRMGYDPTGETCHHAFMGVDAPCPFCPAWQCSGCYHWEHFDAGQARLYSVSHQFIDVEGVSCRVGQAEDVSEILRLSRSAVEYLSLTKFLSEMQACIISDQDRTLEIVMEFLRVHFRAAQVAVTYPGAHGTELLLATREGLVQRTISGQTPELDEIRTVSPSILRVGERCYEFRMVDPANAGEWSENRQSVLCIVQTYLENALLRERIEWDSHHDKSTALYNRAHFMQLSHTVYPNLSRVGVIFLDIDDLKKINDERGHDMGDRLIEKAADVLLGVSGEHIHAYRMGGDEFLLVCCGATRQEVSALLDRVMEGLAGSNELIPMPKLSISAGWACGQAPINLEELVAKADQMMYAAKRAKKAARA